MAENSKIAWTDHTFNPWIGCTKVGPGCDNCYAENMMDHRYHRVQWGAGNERSRTKPANWRKPLAWNKIESERRQRVFCASLADVFDNEVPIEWRNDLFRLIDATPNLDWLLLTKRIGNVSAMLEASYCKNHLPENVWLGITVVTQEEVDRDIPKLLGLPIPPTVIFLSCEPMLEPLRINEQMLLEIDWVICGGESGPNARPMLQPWARALAAQCEYVDTPFFMKQGSQANWSDWKDFGSWHSDLQVREFPDPAGPGQ